MKLTIALFVLCTLSAKARNLGGFPGTPLDPSSVDESQNTTDVPNEYNNPDNSIGDGPASPWASWMSLKAPPISLLKPKKKLLPIPYLTTSGASNGVPTGPGSPLETPWGAWTSMKMNEFIPSPFNPSPSGSKPTAVGETPWDAWTNMKTEFIPYPFNPNPVKSSPSEETPWGSWTKMKLTPIASSLGIKNPVPSKSPLIIDNIPSKSNKVSNITQAEDKLLISWAKKIFDAGKIKGEKNKTSLLQSAWSDWLKLHNVTEPVAIPSPVASPIQSLVPEEDEELLKYAVLGIKLLNLGLPTSTVSKVLQKSFESIPSELAIMGIPLPVINDILSNPTESVAVQLQNMGLSEGVIADYLANKSQNLVTELSQIGFPPGTILEALLGPTEPLLPTTPPSPTPIVPSTEKAIGPKFTTPIQQLIGKSPPEIATTLQSLGIPPETIQEILFKSPLEIVNVLRTLELPSLKIQEMVLKTPTEIRAELEKLGVPPSMITNIITTKEIPFELQKLGILKENIVEVMLKPSSEIITEIRKLGIPESTITEIVSKSPADVAKELQDLDLALSTKPSVVPSNIPKVFLKTPKDISEQLLQIGIPSTKISDILLKSPTEIAQELEIMGLPPQTIQQLVLKPAFEITAELQNFPLPPSTIATLVSGPLNQIPLQLNKLGFPMEFINAIIMRPVSDLQNELLKAEIPISKIADTILKPTGEIVGKLTELGLPIEKMPEILLQTSPEILSTLESIGLSPTEASEIVLKSPSEIKAELLKMEIPSSQVIEYTVKSPEEIITKLQSLDLATPEIIMKPLPAIISELSQLGLPPAVLTEIQKIPTSEMSTTLLAIGVPSSEIPKILLKTIPEIEAQLENASIPSNIIEEILLKNSSDIAMKLMEEGVAPELVKDITTKPITEIIPALETIPLIQAESINSKEIAPENLLAIGKSLIELGVSPLQSIHILSLPPVDMVHEFEKLGIPLTRIKEILTPMEPINPEVEENVVPSISLVMNLQLLGVPPPLIQKLVSLNPPEMKKELEALGVPVKKVEEIISSMPPSASTANVTKALLDNLSSIDGKISLALELLKIGTPPTDVERIISLPPKQLVNELEKVTSDIKSAPQEVQVPERLPETPPLPLSQLKLIIQTVLDECNRTKTNLATRSSRSHSKKHSSSNRKSKSHKKPKSTEDMKRALYPAGPIPSTGLSFETTTSKSKILGDFIPQEFWDLVPTVAPNTTIIDPGYWAAKKSMFISKLFDALARVTMNYTNAATSTTTMSPKDQLQKQIDTVLLSDAARSIKSDDENDNSEEMSTDDEDLINSEEPANLPKEPDNPLHKLFKFGVQKTILSDSTTNVPVAPLIPLTVPTTPATTSPPIIDQQKVILDKLKKLYNNSKKSYKKSKNKSKARKFRGSSTTSSPIDFEELAKALLVQPSR